MNTTFCDRQLDRYGKSDLLPVAALICIGLVLFLPGSLLRDVWGPDEVRYARIAHEMVQSGQWMLPHVNYEVYSDKPPMLFWLIAISATLLGGFRACAISRVCRGIRLQAKQSQVEGPNRDVSTFFAL